MIAPYWTKALLIIALLFTQSLTAQESTKSGQDLLASMDTSGGFAQSQQKFNTSNLNQYLNELIRQAKKKKLAQSKEWLRLGHYRSTILGYKSEADGDRFFMAKDGKQNPQNELQETLRGFLFSDMARPDVMHPQCRFPARFQWLTEKLGFNKSKMPIHPCDRFRAWKGKLNVGSITIVFSSYYINNPASMFGHTLLKLNNKDYEGKAEILDYSANFAANVNAEEENMFIYPLLGLGGGYPGAYTIFPYYLKLNEYNDFESRDIWEYKLNLTEEETSRLMAHMWELGSTWFDYFYIDENCSYQLLTLLEVARPSLEISDDFFYFVQPIDTIKVLKKYPGLIEKVKFRPSLRSTYLLRRESLTDREKNEFQKSISKYTLPAESLPEVNRAKIIDTALDYLFFLQAGRPYNLNSEETNFKDILLSARALIPAAPTPTKDLLLLKYMEDPINGHESSQLGIATGFSDSQQYYKIFFSPTLRFLHDHPMGYAPYSQMHMLSTELLYVPGVNDAPTLASFYPVEILSLTPIERTIVKPSWQIAGGFESIYTEIPDAQNWHKIYAVFKAGMGFALKTPDQFFIDDFTFYVIPTARFEVGSWMEKNLRLGPSLYAGILYRPLSWLTYYSHFDYRWMYLSLANESLQIESGFNFFINNRFAIEIEYSYRLIDKRNAMEVMLKHYF